jgi:hypothetical protein
VGQMRMWRHGCTGKFVMTTTWMIYKSAEKVLH